jgi:hypothetical protein
LGHPTHNPHIAQICKNEGKSTSWKFCLPLKRDKKKEEEEVIVNENKLNKPKRVIKDERKHAGSIIICISPDMAAKFVEVGININLSERKNYRIEMVKLVNDTFSC